MIGMLKFELSFSSDNDSVVKTVTIDPAVLLVDDFEEFKEDTLVELGDGWDYDEYRVVSWDTDYASPHEFADLDAYGEYAEAIDKYGEAFALRFEDLGGYTASQFDEEYRGCWNSEEDFVRFDIEGCYDIPDWLKDHINWESAADERLADYSVYEGSEGVHIFADF